MLGISTQLRNNFQRKKENKGYQCRKGHLRLSK